MTWAVGGGHSRVHPRPGGLLSRIVGVRCPARARFGRAAASRSQGPCGRHASRSLSASTWSRRLVRNAALVRAASNPPIGEALMASASSAPSPPVRVDAPRLSPAWPP